MSDWPDALPIGIPVLIYRYTVAGSDKTSIDTGVDTPSAGSNDWTNCDLLEIIISARTDEAVQTSLVNIILNNDAGSVYDRDWTRGIGSSYSGSAAAAEAAVRLGQVPGTSIADTSVVGVIEAKIPNPTGTVFNKGIISTWGVASPGGSGQNTGTVAFFNYRPASPAALTRLQVFTDTSGKKLKVGSQLLIYKRLAS